MRGLSGDPGRVPRGARGGGGSRNPGQPPGRFQATPKDTEVTLRYPRSTPPEMPRGTQKYNPGIPPMDLFEGTPPVPPGCHWATARYPLGTTGLHTGTPARAGTIPRAVERLDHHPPITDCSRARGTRNLKTFNKAVAFESASRLPGTKRPYGWGRGGLPPSRLKM